MLGINQDQVLSAVRWIASTGGAWLVSKGYATNEMVTLGTGAILAIVPFIWSMVVHSDGTSA